MPEATTATRSRSGARGRSDDARSRRAPSAAPSPGGDGNGQYVAEDGAQLGADFMIPGVDPDDDDPYRWHTGEKRDHGGEDAIEIIDLVKQFGRTRILNGLNLGLPDDQISMVLGPSGTGKSVLIKHIVGLLYPDSGDVLVHGESVPNMTDDELFEVRKKFGLLFQDGALFGSMNIFDNVAFPLRQHTDKGEDEIEEICYRRLERSASPRRTTRCRTSSRAECASGPASRARWSSTRRSSCSTSPTPASTRCAPRCSAS